VRLAPSVTLPRHPANPHSQVRLSDTRMWWVGRSKVNRLSGWFCMIASSPLGTRPVRMAGTAWRVASATVEWRRYHVLSSAKAARFGKRTGSMWSSSSRSDLVGSSSSTRNTTDGSSVASVVSPWDDAVENTSLDGAKKRNVGTASAGSTAVYRAHVATTSTER
jgi:hypothetical protein